MAARESKPTNLLTNLTQPAYNYYGGGGADGESAADRYDAVLLTTLKKTLPNCVTFLCVKLCVYVCMYVCM